MTPNPVPTRFIGCDVGKASIVVFDSHDGRTRDVPNRPAELAALAATLDASCLVVCEATGGYEAALLHALLEAGRAVHRADARKVKAFIRSFGILGKTDAIDARALARYAAERHAGLTRWRMRDAGRDQLRTLVLTRCDLVDHRVACGNRMAAPGAEAACPYLAAMLECLNNQIAAIEAHVKALIKADETLDQDTRTLRGQTGIGWLTATSLLAVMPELGTLNRRQAGALGGLAPHPCQSGARDGYRRTKGGRPEVRRVLFMAALTAARHDKKLSEFYQRLIRSGKKPIVAITAVMRKMLVICNAMLRPKPAGVPV